MEQVKIGLIGLGFMGSTHFRIHRANPHARIVALADVDPAKRRGDVSSVAGNIGTADNSVPLDLAGVAVYEDALKLIAETDADMIDICTPTPFHADLAVAALEHGKHVLCEKPFARTSAEAARIVEAARRSGRFLNIDMCVRAWNEYDAVRALYRQGKLGKLKSAVFKRFSPSIAGTSWNDWFMKKAMSGGALFDMHLHDADFIRATFGRPARVTSFGTNFRGDAGIDHVITRYDFGDGALVAAEGNWNAPRTAPFSMTFEIIGDQAAAVLDHSGCKIHYEDGRVEEIPPGAEPTGWHAELHYFVECVRTGTAPDRYQTPGDVLDGIKIVEAEQQSIDRGVPVQIQY